MNRVLERRRGTDVHRAGRDPTSRSQRAARRTSAWRCRTSATSTGSRSPARSSTATHGTGARPRQPGDDASSAGTGRPATARSCVPTKPNDPELLRVGPCRSRCAGHPHRGHAALRPGVQPARGRDHRAARRRDRRLRQHHAVDRPRRVLLDARRRRCQVKRNTPHRRSRPEPQPKLAYVRDKWIGENLAFGTVCRVGRRFPSLAPKVAKLVTSAAAGARAHRPQRPDLLQPAPRPLRRDGVRHPVRGRARRDRSASTNSSRTLPFPPLFPIEVRVSAADDIPLSTANGRDVGMDRHPPVPSGRRTRPTSRASSRS